MDRWVSILKPLHYESIITAKKITVFNVTSFIGTGIIFGILTMLSTGETDSFVTDNQAVDDVIFNGTTNISGTLNICSYSDVNNNFTEVEYMNSQNTSWVWIVAMLGMNMITIGLYTAILFELKKQLRKIQPNISDPQTMQRPINMYKGTIKLLFIMIYFTIIWGGSGFVSLLLITSVVQNMMSPKTYIFFYHIYSVLVMTPCIVNITVYGIATNQFMHELKTSLKIK